MNERIRELAIDWASQLDWDFPSDPTNYTFSSTELEKFAELIAAAEREACARVCETFINGSAGLVDNTAQVCADAIRARGDA